MGKSILLVNMPDKCKDCEFYYEFECIGRCKLNSALVQKDEKPDWCPLGPLPKKKELSYEDFAYDSRAAAWNSCIDAITGTNRLKKERRQQDRLMNWQQD